MGLLHMIPAMRAVYKCFTTKQTFVRSLATVQGHMIFKVPSTLECAIANGAFMLLLARMDGHMHLKRVLGIQNSITLWAGVVGRVVNVLVPLR